MTIRDDKLGVCYVSVTVERSAVDSYIHDGYSEKYERELTEEELEYLQDKYNGEVQAYAYENGSIYHN